MKLFANRRNVIFIVAVFSAIILAIVLIGPRKESTLCHNNTQDRGEDGVDCGGSCDTRCHPISRLGASKTFIVDTGNKKSSGLVVVINNSNDLYGLSSFSYDLVGYDQYGEEIIRKSGESYISPNHEKYLAELNIEKSLLERIKSVDFETYKEVWNKLSQFSHPNIFVLNKKFEDTSNTLITTASGRLTNNSAYNIKDIDVVAALLSDSGDLRTITYTNINDLTSGERRDFKVSWLVNGQDGDKFELMSEFNIFEESGFVGEFNPERVPVQYTD